MRSTDHKRIAEAVTRIASRQCSELELAYLKDGSVQPDEVGNLKSIGHHKGKTRWKAIKTYIFEARMDFIKGDRTRSALHLGATYHFVADAMCPPSDSGEHRVWEAKIARLPIPQVSPLAIPTPAHLDKCVISKLKEHCPTPYTALETSIALCAGLLELTWRPLHERTLEDERVIKTLSVARFARRLLKSICAAAIITCSVIFVDALEGWFYTFWFAILGISFSFFVIDEVANVRGHHRILKWYGLK
jgi:hypothetical protein